MRGISYEEICFCFFEKFSRGMTFCHFFCKRNEKRYCSNLPWPIFIEIRSDFFKKNPFFFHKIRFCLHYFIELMSNQWSIEREMCPFSHSTRKGALFEYSGVFFLSFFFLCLLTPLCYGVVVSGAFVRTSFVSFASFPSLSLSRASIERVLPRLPSGME